MNKNTIKTVRAAIKESLAQLDLSDYKINKIIKSELENPRSWGNPDDKKDDEETPVLRYYSNLSSQNVFINWKQHLAASYSIDWFTMLRK